MFQSGVSNKQRRASMNNNNETFMALLQDYLARVGVSGSLKKSVIHCYPYQSVYPLIVSIIINYSIFLV